MKKLIIYLCLITTSILSMGAGCGKDDEDIKKDQFTSLIGYWVIKGGEGKAIKQDDSQIVIGTVNPDITAMEFFEDGTMKSYDLTHQLPDETGTWKLEVYKTDGQDIEEGKLSIYTTYTMDHAGTEFINADGSIKYAIATINNVGNNGKARMYLTTDKFVVDPYKQIWNDYIYEKR